MTTVDDIDGDIRIHVSTANFISTLLLIPYIIALLLLIAILLLLGSWMVYISYRAFRAWLDRQHLELKMSRRNRDILSTSRN